MEKKNKKIIAGILAYSVFIGGCKITFDYLTGKTTEVVNRPNCTTSETSENIEPESSTFEETEEVEETTTETEEPSIETTSDSTEEETQETTTYQTEPTQLPTEEETIPTELPEETQGQTTPQVPEEQITDIIVEATETVNIRASNNDRSMIIGQLEINEAAYRLLSCDNNWDLVRTNDKIGYVCRDYLEYTAQTYDKGHKIVFNENNDIVVTTSELNFRTGPSTDYPIKKAEVTVKEDVITEIDWVFKENEELKVVAEVDDEWLLVEYNGEFGYVHKGYTVSLLEKLQATYPELGIENFELQKVVYANGEPNIRAGNSTDYDTIGSLQFPETARVYGEYDGWYLIMTNEHQFGFVSKELVTELEGKTTIKDLSEQRMYMYNDNQNYIYTPITTGKDSTPTDIGITAIHYMATDIYLNGDRDWVNFWMNCNGNNEGIHDAWWRRVYGEDNYHYAGSNGCTNTPYEAVKTLYNNSELGQRVIVHR